MRKKIITPILAFILFIACISYTSGAENEISVILDEKRLTFDVPPQIIDNRTMVPIRSIFESMGASVDWNDKTNTAVCTKGDTVVKMTVGSKIENVNNENIEMDVPPIIINNRILAPARFVAESFGYSVEWDTITKTVFISSGKIANTILTGTYFDLNTTIGLLSYETGEILGGGRYISDFLEINQGILLKDVLQVVDPKYSTICYYDQNKKFIKAERFASNDIKEKEIFPNKHYKYVRYTSAVKTSKYQRYVPKNNVITSDNFGKSVAVFGGSFAAVDMAKNSLNYWGEKLGFVIDVYAVGGAGFRKTSNTIQTQVNTACAETSPKYDIYIFWASSNDLWAGTSEIGTALDYTESDGFDESKLSTQNGGINYCIKKIYEKNPNAKICFLTSIRIFCTPGGYDINAKDNYALIKFVDGQIACCKQWGIPYLDQFRNFELNLLNKSTYVQADNLHLNDNGYDLIKNMQVDFLSKI